MRKYAGFLDYLNKLNDDRLVFKFIEIESLSGVSLPPSAYKNPRYWQPSPRHTFPIAILECGYYIEQVDLKNQTLSLSKSAK